MIPWIQNFLGYRRLWMAAHLCLLSLYLAAAEHRQLSVSIPARDGVMLATDIYLPEGSGPFPVVLARTPYNKASAGGLGNDGTSMGFAVVVQDTRGRFASKGANLPFHTDGWGRLGDGLDTVEWIRKQPWYGGKIATFGGSAGAITQFMLSGSGTDEIVFQHLVVGTASLYHNGIYQGGAFRTALVEKWLEGAAFDPEALAIWTGHPVYDDFWRERDLGTRWDLVQWPAVHVGGWYDIFAQATLDAYQGYNEQGGVGARGAQVLVMGPWTHGVLQKQAGELTFPGGDSVPDDAARHSAYWRRYLGDGDADSVPRSGVYYYVMGDQDEPSGAGNEWRRASTWPPFETVPTAFYLNADRSLGAEKPTAAESALSFQYDPQDPVPTIGGAQLTIPAGPKDQRTIETRPDVLVFTSPPLAKPLEVTGRVRARLWVASDGPDTDFVVRLCDVYPDGRSMNVCEGILRTRFREGLDREVPLVPGERTAIEVDLWSTSLIFGEGHRLRVHVTSSSSPGWDPNPNTGEPFRHSDRSVAVTNHVWSTEAAPSQVILPLPLEQKIAFQ